MAKVGLTAKHTDALECEVGNKHDRVACAGRLVLGLPTSQQNMRSLDGVQSS